MNKPSRFWRIVAIVFLIVNALGAVYAFVLRQQMHAEMHLALFGAAFVGYVFSRAAQTQNDDIPSELPEIEDPRVAQLQRSVDAMALELARLGEAQRFRDKLEAEKRERPQG
jgi:hypothetical protein